MKLVATGLLNKQVADELGISVITVKAQMMAGSLADLVKMDARLGISRAPQV